MEQTLDGGAKQPPLSHAFQHGGHSSTTSYPTAVDSGYRPSGNAPVTNKYHSPRHGHHEYHSNVDRHHAKAKVHTTEGGVYSPAQASLPLHHNPNSVQAPYNPTLVTAQSNSDSRYFNPNVINPPLPPLPPPSLASATPTSYSKPSPSDAYHRPAQDASLTYPRPHQTYPSNQHFHPSSTPSTSSSSQSLEFVKCQRCGDKGHIAPPCPTRRPYHPSSYSKHLPPRTCKYWLNGNCHKGDDCTFVHGLVPDANGMVYPPTHMLRHQGGYPPMDQTFYYPPPPMPHYSYDPNAHRMTPPPDEALEYHPPPPAQGYGGAPPYYPYDNSYYPYPGHRSLYSTPPPAAATYHQQPPPPPPPLHVPSPNYPTSKPYNYYAQPQPYHPRQGYASFPADQYDHVESFASSDGTTPSTRYQKDLPSTADLQPLPSTPCSPSLVPAPTAASDATDSMAALTIETSSSEQAEGVDTRSKSVTSPTEATTKAADRKKKKKATSKPPPPPPAHAEVPVTAKGLRNDTGDNNCFLNVVVQALFHLETFQSRWADTASHVCAGGGRCVYCALASVFALLGRSSTPTTTSTTTSSSTSVHERQGVSSDALRKVLSAISTSPLPAAEERYKAGSMDDAAEAHETILRSLHESLSSAAAAAAATPCPCLAHEVFGLWVGEEAECGQCGMSMETLPYDAMVLHVATESIKEVTSKKHKTHQRAFDDVLATVWAAAGSSKKCARCRHDKVYESRLQLKQVPRMFTVGLTWKNNSANVATLKAIVAAMEPSIRLGRVFPNMVAEGRLAGPDQGSATLLAMYCFFGHHYMAFIYKVATREWLSFNDTVVRRVGTQWSDVQAACIEVG
ncbi:hypothetical protein, variant 1 [Aphanomyces astaci]|uniref:USP domain-containing protein n=1 Tax=Aphanomyces astaci TaxID=112090 RepID=W4GYU2_APHAT|nr:hypothetical protein, variant 1 [Aphanomyces astaci]ETV84501.1 hypothetical protein, variant 1 [Aphanomyces astaci]|eukprot:XP_009826193.1 hypothetical protein, variant 1 [Aphanomyces astaci]